MIFLYGFFAWVLLEIATFIAIGGEIGFISTILLYVVLAAVGGFVVQAQGLLTMEKARTAFDRGVLPMDDMFDALCLLAAGLLLIAPGFLGDVLAFALLLPPVRAIIRSWISHKYDVQPGQVNPDTGVIEGEFVRISEEDSRLTPPRA